MKPALEQVWEGPESNDSRPESNDSRPESNDSRPENPAEASEIISEETLPEEVDVTE